MLMEFASHLPTTSLMMQVLPGGMVRSNRLEPYSCSAGLRFVQSKPVSEDTPVSGDEFHVCIAIFERDTIKAGRAKWLSG